MTYTFIIEGKLANLNDYLSAERVSIRGARGNFNTKGNVLKQESMHTVISYIRKYLRGVKITKPIKIRYTFFEPNKKRDLDNIASFAMKIIQDALVKSGVLQNDGWNNIYAFECNFDVDKDRPHIVVELIEKED